MCAREAVGAEAATHAQVQVKAVSTVGGQVCVCVRQNNNVATSSSSSSSSSDDTATHLSMSHSTLGAASWVRALISGRRARSAADLSVSCSNVSAESGMPSARWLRLPPALIPAASTWVWEGAGTRVSQPMRLRIGEQATQSAADEPDVAFVELPPMKGDLSSSTTRPPA